MTLSAKKMNALPLVAAAAAALSLSASPVRAQAALVNNDFEVSYDGWGTLGDFTELAASSGAAYSSRRGMEVTGRRSPSDGAFSNKGLYLEGGETYAYSVFVRHGGAADETFGLTLKWFGPDGKAAGSEVIASAVARPDSWTRLSASYAAPKGAAGLTVSIATNSAADFSFDKFTVTGKDAGRLAKAAADDKGLKDVFANYFLVGTCYPSSWNNVTPRVRELILREFNSVTLENEMKPDYTMQASGHSNDNIRVTLNQATAILDFCVQNNLWVRGHTLVWHSQSPEWFYKDNFTNGGNWVTAAVLNQRIESYIKNLFALIATQYPTLNLYAYDVVNECYNDQGGHRSPGYGGDNSPLVQVYGATDSFIETAFKFARQYAPASCKLYYNDFNEYASGKRGAMTALATNLLAKGYIDGLGMQSHLSTNYPDSSAYRAALNAFAGVSGLEISVTELDITIEGTENRAPTPAELSTQATRYRQIFNSILDVKKAGAKIPSVTIWGTTDDRSWRKDKKPLLFDSTYQKKPAYDAIAALIPQSEWGDGTPPPPPPPPPPQTDANGYFFWHNFEDGTTMDWGPRGGNNLAIANTAAQKNSGSRSLYVTGREQDWHGISYSLTTRIFEPGKTYSFSVMVMYPEGPATDTVKLTLQYTNAEGEQSWQGMAAAQAAKGEWAQLANPNFEIPAGANDLMMYVEMKSTGQAANFYIDDAMGGIAGATLNPDGTPGENPGATSAARSDAARGRAPLFTVKAGTLTVNTSPEAKVRVRVVSLTGKTVAKFNAQGGSALSLKKIPAGAYIIEARGIKDGSRMTSSIILR